MLEILYKRTLISDRGDEWIDREKDRFTCSCGDMTFPFNIEENILDIYENLHCT